MKIRVLSSDDVRQALPMKAAIEETKRAFSRLSSGRVEMPLRSSVHIPKQDGVLLTMPAALLEDGEMAVKLVTVFGKKTGPWFPPDSCSCACAGCRKWTNPVSDGR